MKKLTNEQLKQRYELVEQFIIEQGDRVHNEWTNFSVVDAEDNGSNPTSNFDVEVETAFFDLIESNFSEDGIVGEELKDRHHKEELTWYIDPIDGTKYFVNGVPMWGITIALMQGDEILIGFVYNPNTKQLYSAMRGAGAYLNGQKLSVRGGLEVNQQQAIWDYIDLSEKLDKEELISLDYENLHSQVMKDLVSLHEKYYRVRNIGNAAYSLCWLAQGMFGAYLVPVLRKSKFVDIAAGLLIAEEAGAKVEIEELSKSVISVSVLV